MFARNTLLGFALATLMVAAVAAAAQTAPYVSTAIVSPTPGNPTASGISLLDTLAGLDPAPSSTHRWLVKIEPGIYDVGASPVQMADFVDIEGSGALVTILRGNVGPTAGSSILNEISTGRSAASLNQGLVRGANNAEIRELTIECIPSASQPACMGMVNDRVSPRITRLRILVIAPSAGGHWGIRNYDASPVLDAVEIRVANATAGADNYGLVNVGESILGITTLRNSQITANGTGFNNWALLNRGNAKANPITGTTLTATGGAHAYGIQHTEGGKAGPYILENSTIMASAGSSDSIGISQEASSDASVKPIIRSSRVAGDTSGVQMSWNNVVVVNSQIYGGDLAVAGGTVKVGGTWIQGGTIFGSTAQSCAGVWDDAFNHYASTCP